MLKFLTYDKILISFEDHILMIGVDVNDCIKESLSQLWYICWSGIVKDFLFNVVEKPIIKDTVKRNQAGILWIYFFLVDKLC